MVINSRFCLRYYARNSLDRLVRVIIQFIIYNLRWDLFCFDSSTQQKMGRKNVWVGLFFRKMEFQPLIISS